MHLATALLGCSLALGLAAGCGGDETAETDPAALIGPWLLASGLDAEGWQESPPGATFTVDTVAGFAGCNRFTAPYTVDGDSLEFGAIALTRMACPPLADAVERAYVAALEQVAGWSVEENGRELVLQAGDGAELLRYAQATPVGDWEATSIRTATALASPLPGTQITASFGDDGSLTGSAGCNRYTTTFTFARGVIQIGVPAATEMACPEPEGVMEQEAAYLAALPTAARYQLDGTSLSLLRANGTNVASFQRAPQP